MPIKLENYFMFVFIGMMANFNDWINVNPVDTNVFKRLKLFIHESFPQKIKALLYRPDQYYISYKFKNDSVVTYRFTIANAVDGLWITPFLIDFKSKIETKQIKMN